jgi:hypothetical protein
MFVHIQCRSVHAMCQLHLDVHEYSQTCPCSHLYANVMFSSPIIEKFIWIEPLLRGHLSYKATFSLPQWCPLNTGLTVYMYLQHLMELTDGIF